MEKKLYYKIYQDKECVDEICNYLVLPFEKVDEKFIRGCLTGEEESEDFLPVVLEPVLLTDEEYQEVAEFDGY
jgi:hypothetical protein